MFHGRARAQNCYRSAIWTAFQPAFIAPWKSAFAQLPGLPLEFSVNIWPRVLRRRVAREAKDAIR
jgi:hypothetical protein